MKTHTSRLLSTLLVLCMVLILLPGTALAAGANYDTIKIYVENRNVWTDSSDWLFFEDSYEYGLIDLEGDGVPELFLSGRGGTGLVSQNHYYKVNVNTRSVYEMQNLPAELESLDLLSGTSIYRDEQTGQLFYYSSDAQRRGWQYSNACHYLFYMHNGALSVKSLWGWECEMAASDPNGKYTYFYYTDSGDRVEVSESNWNQYQKDYLKRYTLVAEFVPAFKAKVLKAVNGEEMAVTLRGMYDKLYQNLDTPAAPSTPKVQLSAQNLTVDARENVACEKYNIDGNNYFKLRDLAALLSGTGSQFEVGYDDASKTISITTGKAYTPNGSELILRGDMSSKAQVSAQTLRINGVKHDDLKVYNIGGNNFFQLRQLGDVLNFDVDFDPAGTGTAIVKSRTAESPDKAAREKYRAIVGQASSYDYESLDRATGYKYALVQMQPGDTVPTLLLEQETMFGLAYVRVFQYDPNTKTVRQPTNVILMEGVAQVGGYRGSLAMAGDGNGILSTEWSSGTGAAVVSRTTFSGASLAQSTVWEGRIDKMPGTITSVEIKWHDIKDLSAL